MHIQGMSQRQQAQIPCPVDKLSCIDAIQDKVNVTRDNKTFDELEGFKKETVTMINLAAQVRSACKQGMADLAGAAKQLSKKEQRDKDRLQLEAALKNRSAAKAAARAIAKTSSPSPAPGPAQSICDVEWVSMTSHMPAFPDEIAFAAGATDITPGEPYLIRKADSVKDILDKAGNLKSGLATFASTYGGTAQAQLTGRASCPMNANSGTVSTLRQTLRKLGPLSAAAVSMETSLAPLGMAFTGALPTH